MIKGRRRARRAQTLRAPRSRKLIFSTDNCIFRHFAKHFNNGEAQARRVQERKQRKHGIIEISKIKIFSTSYCNFWQFCKLCDDGGDMENGENDKNSKNRLRSTELEKREFGEFGREKTLIMDRAIKKNIEK